MIQLLRNEGQGFLVYGEEENGRRWYASSLEQPEGEKPFVYTVGDPTKVDGFRSIEEARIAREAIKDNIRPTMPEGVEPKAGIISIVMTTEEVE